MKKTLLLAALLAGTFSYAQECTAVVSLDENFNTFTFTNPGTGLPQNCWSKISEGPMLYIDGEEGENYVTFYASTFADVDSFLITPELTTLNGSYELSFDTQRVVMGPPPAPGTVTIQLGTLSDNTDAETFVVFGEPITVTDEYITHNNIVITADETQKYIAFKIVGDTQHNAALIDNVVWSEITSVCDATETIDENFNEFAADNFPQNCWLSLTDGPMVYVDQNEEETDKYATFYSFMSANTAGYLITPEITASTTTRTLKFDSFKIGEGAVTIQIGTISDAEDFDTFTAIGDLLTLTAEPDGYSIEIPSLNNNIRLAFQIIADTPHHAAIIDNVELTGTLGNINFNKTGFSIYPNPSADKNITVVLNNDIEKTNLSIYNITGAKVFETALRSNTQQINLSSLTSGMYIIKLQARNYTETKKLIIK